MADVQSKEVVTTLKLLVASDLNDISPIALAEGLWFRAGIHWVRRGGSFILRILIKWLIVNLIVLFF